MPDTTKPIIIFQTLHSKLLFHAISENELLVENQHKNTVCNYTFSYEDVHALLSYLVNHYDFPIDLYFKPSSN